MKIKDRKKQARVKFAEDCGLFGRWTQQEIDAAHQRAKVLDKKLGWSSPQEEKEADETHP